MRRTDTTEAPVQTPTSMTWRAPYSSTKYGTMWLPCPHDLHATGRLVPTGTLGYPRAPLPVKVSLVLTVHAPGVREQAWSSSRLCAYGRPAHASAVCGDRKPRQTTDDNESIIFYAPEDEET